MLPQRLKSLGASLKNDQIRSRRHAREQQLQVSHMYLSRQQKKLQNMQNNSATRPVYSVANTELGSIGRRMRRARGSRPSPSPPPPPPLQLKFQQRGAKQSFSTKTCGIRFHALLRPAPLPFSSLARVCAACRLNPSEAARARRAIA